MRPVFTRAWGLLFSATVACVVAVDALLLGLSTGYFTGGFNSVYVEGPGEVAAYLLAALVLDCALVLGLWLLALPLLRRITASRAELLGAAGLLALAIPGSVAVVHYRLYATLGGLVSVSLLSVGSGSSLGMASMAMDELPPYGWIAAGLALSAGAAFWLLARRLGRRVPDAEGRLEPPGFRRLVLPFACLGLVGALLLGATDAHWERIHYGLERKASGIVLAEFVRKVSDVDGDGFGLLSSPGDPAAFDGAIHPWAPDLPGNGIDENGLAGDHPVDFRLSAAAPVPVEKLPQAAAPHFLLVYLESFRGDLIGRRVAGREVTPFLNRLAEEGIAADAAWVHSPWTVPSRAQLFTGELVPRPGQATLVDDFRERGYRVGYFSGQDESFGHSVELLGVERADRFYDARQDVARRTSRTTAAVSLQVSWKTLLERVFAFLSESDPNEPLFLYVNFVDTHFPYVHDELDDILGVESITRADIRSDQAERVRGAYANAAANVDRGIEELVTAWRSHFQGHPQAILVTADHGQSFYENGTLGHGQELSDAQARVPLILWGLGGDWPEPIGPADLRGLLMGHLFAARGQGTPRARFVVDPGRRVFQYLGPLQSPERLGLRSSAGLLDFDFKKGRARFLEGEGLPGGQPKPAELDQLIWTWETLQQRALDAKGS